MCQDDLTEIRVGVCAVRTGVRTDVRTDVRTVVCTVILSDSSCDKASGPNLTVIGYHKVPQEVARRRISVACSHY